MHFKYYVNAQNSGRTVMSILKYNFKFSRNLIQRFKYHGKVLCNGLSVYMSHIVTSEDVIEAYVDFIETSENVKPEQMNLCILYEDEYIIALDKPPGIIIHPTGTTTEGTIANGLMYYFKSKGYHIKIRPISRLDRDTTGVIVFTKNQFIQDRLAKQMIARQYHKEYIGIVHGSPAEASGTINLPIARTTGSIIQREVSTSGAPSLTHYTAKEYFSSATMMQFILETGRTHQIRVHCQSMGHPLIGDTLYSHIPTPLISRQALHAHYVRFSHPVTDKTIELMSPLPQDILNLLGFLRIS